MLRLPHDPGGRLRAEAEAVRRDGLASARWVAVDDTGARHRARSGVCTRLGDGRLTAFATRGSAGRRAFLELVCGEAPAFVLDEAALAAPGAGPLPAKQVARLAGHPRQRFADAAAWAAHPEELGLAAPRRSPDPVALATEAALWGCAVERGVPFDPAILGDGAGRFRAGDHAPCWVHAERLGHAPPCLGLAQRAVVGSVREAVRGLYRRLQAWRLDPRPEEVAALEAAFDEAFGRKVPNHPELTRLLARLRGRKGELPAVPRRPALPLHTNAAENDPRAYVTRREVSFGTRSEVGRDGRAAAPPRLKAAAKLGVSSRDLLAARFGVQGAPDVPPLDELVLRAA